MSDDGDALPGAVLYNNVGSFYEGATRIRHIIDDDGNTVAHITDQYHAADFIGPGTLFVDESKSKVKSVGYGGCSS